LICHQLTTTPPKGWQFLSFALLYLIDREITILSQIKAEYRRFENCDICHNLDLKVLK
jgi:hypothetical protein